MGTYKLSFKLRTDLDSSQLFDLLEALTEALVEDVESHGGMVEDPNLPKNTVAVVPE